MPNLVDSAQRAILADLVTKVIPVRVGHGRYRAWIRWTPLGQALRRLADAVTAA